MDWAMARPAFKTQLFRFVDVFPALRDDADVAAHLRGVLHGDESPRLLEPGIDMADRVPLGSRRRGPGRPPQHPADGPAVHRGRRRPTRRSPACTACGARAAPSLSTCSARRRSSAPRPTATRPGSHELLATLADASAGWAPDDHLERDDLGPLPRVNVSVKPTALATHYEPLSRDAGVAGAKERLRPLLRLARERGAFVHVDMEHYDAKDLTLQLFRDLLSEDEFADLPAGIVIQAYLRDSRDDLADLIAWSARRPEPVTVRLVKGAYWDAETVHARAEGWPVPVFEDKAADRRQLRALRTPAARPPRRGAGRIRLAQPAVAGLRRHLRPPPGHPGHRLRDPDALRDGRADARRHPAAGAAAAGVRAGGRAGPGHGVPRAAAAGEHVERVVRAPPLRRGAGARRAAGAAPGGRAAAARHGGAPPRHRPRGSRLVPARAGVGVAAGRRPRAAHGWRPWRRRAVRSAPTSRPDRWRAGQDRGHADVGRPAVRPRWWRRPRRAARPTPTRAVAAAVAAAGAVAARAGGRAGGGAVPGRRLAAAPAPRGRRPGGFEAGKPWDQSDADVCEAIDFCEYYGREVLRLDGLAAELVQSPPGEANRLSYQGKGVTAVIAPWNFPLAIPCGHGHGRAGGRQPGDPQAGRADAAGGVAAGRGAGGGRGAARA